MSKAKIGKKIFFEGIQLFNLSETDLLAELGASFTYDYSPKDKLLHLHHASIIEFGNEIMRAVWYEMYGRICDSKNYKPNENLLNDDKQLLLGAVITDLLSIFSLTANTAAVIAVILIKKGLFMLCSYGPPAKPKNSVRRIIRSIKITGAKL